LWIQAPHELHSARCGKPSQAKAAGRIPAQSTNGISIFVRRR
jgi:hypothetical protein